MDRLTMERVALDVLIECEISRGDIDGQLSEEERAEYLREQARKLAPFLQATAADFLDLHLQPVSSWKEEHADRQGRRG